MPISSKELDNSSTIENRRVDKSFKIFSISKFSSALTLLILLFNSNTEEGSIYTVEPLADISNIAPDIKSLYSCFTGITNLSFLIVIIESIKYLEYEEECIKLDNFSRKDCSKLLLVLRKEDNLEDASSAIVFSSIIEIKILFSIVLLKYKDENNGSKLVNSDKLNSLSPKKYSCKTLAVFKTEATSNKAFAESGL